MLLENTFLHIKWSPDPDGDIRSHPCLIQLLAGVQHKLISRDTKIPFDTY